MDSIFVSSGLQTTAAINKHVYRVIECRATRDRLHVCAIQ